jgi:hypothetical protein
MALLPMAGGMLAGPGTGAAGMAAAPLARPCKYREVTLLTLVWPTGVEMVEKLTTSAAKEPVIGCCPVMWFCNQPRTTVGWWRQFSGSYLDEVVVPARCAR